MSWIFSIVSRVVTPFVVAGLLTGCATWDGDFGRPEESKLYSQTRETVRNVRDEVRGVFWGRETSDYALTPDEEGLREAAGHFSTDIDSLYPIIHVPGQEEKYANRLTKAGYAVGANRHGTLLSQLERDHLVFTRFERHARVVIAADRDRLNQLKDPYATYTVTDRRNTRNRVQENRQIVVAVLRNVFKRIYSYDYALERALLENPGAAMTEAVSQLNLLRERVALFKQRYHDQGYLDTDIEIEPVSEHYSLSRRREYSERTIEVDEPISGRNVNWRGAGERGQVVVEDGNPYSRRHVPMK